MQTHKIAETRAVLKPDMSLALRQVSDDFYQRLEADFDGFKGHVLVSQHEFTEDWPTWEMHPKGDELVLLLGGEAEMLLRGKAGDSSVQLRQPGDYLVVPRGAWHTAKVKSSASMLFFTPGEGTANEAEPPASATLDG